MPERTIKTVYYTTLDGTLISRGATVDLSEEDAARYDSLAVVPQSRKGYLNDESVHGGVHTDAGGGPGTVASGDPLPVEGDADNVEGLTPSEMTDVQIESLSGKPLDDAVEMAGIDPSSGGSLADGSLSADEKRAALKAQNAEARKG
jgi:hypothetical protein